MFQLSTVYITHSIKYIEFEYDKLVKVFSFYYFSIDNYYVIMQKNRIVQSLNDFLNFGTRLQYLTFGNLKKIPFVSNWISWINKCTEAVVTEQYCIIMIWSKLESKNDQRSINMLWFMLKIYAYGTYRLIVRK